MKQYLDRVKLAEYSQKLTNKYKSIFATKLEVGSPLVASSMLAMTDKTKIYVYVGTGSGNTGHWYYYNTSTNQWTDGGVYNSTAFETDPTLSIPGAAADAKATGDKFSGLSVPADFHVEAIPEAGEAPYFGLTQGLASITLTTSKTMDQLLDRALNDNELTISGGIKIPFPDGASYPDAFECYKMVMPLWCYVTKEFLAQEGGPVSTKDALLIRLEYYHTTSQNAIVKDSHVNYEWIIYENSQGNVLIIDNRYIRL